MMQWRNVSPYHLNSIKNCQSGARLFNFKTITPFANFTHVFVFCLVCMQHPSFNNFSELATLLWFTKKFTYPKLRPTARNWCCLSFPFWKQEAFWQSWIFQHLHSVTTVMYIQPLLSLTHSALCFAGLRLLIPENNGENKNK